MNTRTQILNALNNDAIACKVAGMSPDQIIEKADAMFHDYYCVDIDHDKQTSDHYKKFVGLVMVEKLTCA
jgi:hypothetical protein